MAGEEPQRDPPRRIASAERPPEWCWWNPFTWFPWGIDWSQAVDQELAIVRQLNLIFGTAHTRLDQFTAEERARIEQALGQKFNWEEASAIRASERELQIRDKVLLGSQVSLAAAGVADAAAGGLVGAEMAGITRIGSTPLWGGAAGNGTALGIGTRATLEPGMAQYLLDKKGSLAGTWPALLVGGRVYVA